MSKGRGTSPRAGPRKPNRRQLSKALESNRTSNTVNSDSNDQNDDFSSEEKFSIGPKFVSDKPEYPFLEHIKNNQFLYGSAVSILIFVITIGIFIGGHLELVDTIDQNVGDIDSRTAELESSATTQNQTLRNIEEGISGLRNDVSNIRNDLETVVRTEERVNLITSEVNLIRSDVGDLNDSVRSIQNQSEINAQAILNLENNQ